MASAIDICNLALAHIGDEATVASLDPPEGSAQASHCARFYPMARDSLLEAHTWNFAVRRAVLAEVANTWTQWQFAYAKPADCLRVISVLPSDGYDDYEANVSENTVSDLNIGGFLAPQKYVIELNDNSASVILTNQEDAIVRYSAFVTDTTKFSPLFVQVLSWNLAAMLAGPVIKGDVGMAESKRCLEMGRLWLTAALTSDTNQRELKLQHHVGWIDGR